MVCGTVIFTMLIASGVYLTRKGHNVVGGTIFGTTITALGANFIFEAQRKNSRIQQKKENTSSEQEQKD